VERDLAPVRGDLARVKRERPRPTAANTRASADRISGGISSVELMQAGRVSV
jgi:hypothetical protein